MYRQQVLFSDKYLERIRKIEERNLIGLYSFGESSGTVAFDNSLRENHGTYNSVALGKLGVGDGGTSVYTDGSSGVMTLPAGFATDFNGNELTILIWGKVSGASVWTDGVERRLVDLEVDANNYFVMRKTTSNNQISWLTKCGGTTKSTSKSSYAPLDWFCWGITHSQSGDAQKLFIDGAQEGATITGLGTFAGSIGTKNLLANNVSNLVWDGTAAVAAFWKTPLSDGLMKLASQVVRT